MPPARRLRQRTAQRTDARYVDDHNTYGGYAAATLLMGLAVLILLLMNLLDRKRSTT